MNIKKKTEKTIVEKPLLIAQKDFKIVQNEYERVIRAGEDVSDIPLVYHANLKTEGVI